MVKHNPKKPHTVYTAKSSPRTDATKRLNFHST